MAKSVFAKLCAFFNKILATNYGEDSKWGWVDTLTSAMESVIAPILAVVAAAGTIYAIVIAVQMAKADSGEKREEAKKRLISIVIAVVVLVVLIVFFTTLFPLIINAFITPETSTQTTIKLLLKN